MKRKTQKAISARKETIDVPSEFLLFCPNSSGGYQELSALTRSCVNSIMPAFVGMAESAGSTLAEIIDINAIKYEGTSLKKYNLLGKLLAERGSGKSTDHDYHKLYATILADPVNIQSVLEIGLGSNNPNVFSNMGLGGHPGASLRAFRDFLPKARIYGADIDKDILFQEERIKTYPVDQLDPAALSKMGELICEEQFDLIIDDGLHAPDANINTLAFALPKVAPGGWVVVEDIRPEAISVWQLASSLLDNSFKSYIFMAKGGVLFAAQKRSRDNQFTLIIQDS